jgi:hypothetical protein
MEALSCRACGAALQAEDLDRRLAIITCSRCGSIFDLARHKARAGADASARPESVERAPAALPQGFDLKRSEDSFKISWRWFTAGKLLLIPFAIAWNAFLVGWYDTALSSDAPWFMVVFPMAHVAAGIAIAWVAVANLVNRSWVTIEGGTLRVRHGPMPWWPRPTLPARDVEQLYCTRKVRQSKNGTSVTFELRAVTRDHAGQLLLGGLDKLEQALWLEQEIERRLDIRDRPVAGEVSKTGGVQL